MQAQNSMYALRSLQFPPQNERVQNEKKTEYKIEIFSVYIVKYTRIINYLINNT